MVERRVRPEDVHKDRQQQRGLMNNVDSHLLIKCILLINEQM